MKKLILIVAFFFLFNFAFCTENTFDNTFENKLFILQTDLTLTLNTGETGAPSPITQELGLNMQIPIVRFNTFFRTGFFFLPQLLVSYNYYKLDYRGRVVPSELENRLASVPMLMLNLPISYNMMAANNTFHAAIGIAFLGRYGFKSTKGTFDSDLEKINKSFYEDLKWLYPNASVSFDTKVGQSSIGFSVAFFISMNNLLNTKDLNESQFKLAFRFGL